MRISAWYVACVVLLVGLSAQGLQAQEPASDTFDGLIRVEDSKADEAFRRPDVDYSIYKRFMILEPAVAFAKDWEREMNRRSTTRIRPSDMERIQNGLAEIFLEVFTQELEKAGYPVVEEEAEDVMTLRPAIIDLRVTAPDVATSGRDRSYVTSAGSARLYIEFYDSVSGQILARAVDFKKAPDWGQFRWATSVSNRQEARKLIRRWATMLVERLDEVHGKN